MKRAAAALGWLLVVCPVQAQTLELRFFDVGHTEYCMACPSPSK